MIKISHLFETPMHRKLVSNWIYNEFWTDVPEMTPQILEELLDEAKTNSEVPQSLVAFYNKIPVGTINLIESDDEKRTHLTPWLAALYVKPGYRALGIGKELVRALLENSKKIYVKELFLGTDKPEFYQKLGAEIIEEDKPGFYILKFKL